MKCNWGKEGEMFSNKSILGMLILLTVALIIAACGPAATPETVTVPGATQIIEKEVTRVVEVTPTPSREQELTIAIGALPTTLMGDMTPSLMSQPVVSLMYESLLKYDEVSGEFKPLLAKSWELVEEDTWRFHLREDVFFHNGEPFDARSVKATMDFVMDPENKSYLRQFHSDLAEVTVVDDYTVDFRMDPPVGTFLYALDSTMMLPPEYLSESTIEEFGEAPVGTGPYKFKEWRRDDYVTLELADNYWGKQPAISTVTFLQRPEAAVRTAALKAGEVDIAYLIPPETVPTLLSEGFDVYTGYVGQVLTIWLDPRSPILADENVRKAILYAVDVEQIWNSIAGGYGRMGTCQVSGPDAFGYNPDLEPYPYDPEKAKELLAGAGYSGGLTIGASSPAGRYYRDKEVMQAVAGYLSQVGITLNVEYLESGAYIDKLMSRSFEPVWIIGQTYAGSDPALRVAGRLYWPEEGWTGEYDDPVWKEKWMDQHLTTDPDKRRPLIQDMWAYVCDQAYAIVLYQIPALYGIAPDVEGITFDSTYSMDLTNVVIGNH
jgi:peptide/nickel transport system substrate-binding protein